VLDYPFKVASQDSAKLIAVGQHSMLSNIAELLKNPHGEVLRDVNQKIDVCPDTVLQLGERPVILIIGIIFGRPKVQYNRLRAIEVISDFSVQSTLTNRGSSTAIRKRYETRVPDCACERLAAFEIALRVVCEKDPVALTNQAPPITQVEEKKT